MNKITMHPNDALREAQAIINTMQFLTCEIPQDRTITLQAGYLNDTLYRICQLLDIVDVATITPPPPKNADSPKNTAQGFWAVFF